jgi:hypothetical protein
MLFEMLLLILLWDGENVLQRAMVMAAVVVRVVFYEKVRLTSRYYSG